MDPKQTKARIGANNQHIMELTEDFLQLRTQNKILQDENTSLKNIFPKEPL